MKKLIAAEAILQYANISQDRAPIHVDAQYAMKAGYKRTVVHGMYLMGIAQSIYLAQNPTKWITMYRMKFEKPLLIDTVASFDFEISGDNINVVITVQSGEVIASGTLSVKERS